MTAHNIDLPHKPQGDDDLLDGLTVRELRVGNGKLRADLVNAITEPTADRWDALALAGWLWAKRTDPAARLDPWTDLTASQLVELLDLNTDPTVDDDQADDQADVDELADPTPPGPSPA